MLKNWVPDFAFCQNKFRKKNLAEIVMTMFSVAYKRYKFYTPY